ncbi:MAG: response regulator [Magnetococcales bacterium]|nr:response regulator [Magnetococcales bacterium]
MAKILIVDDDISVRALLRSYLESDGHQVDEAVDGKQASKRYRENIFNIVITDIFMPEQDGLELIMELKECLPSVKIIAISGGGHGMEAQLVLKLTRFLGSVQQLKKPFTRIQVLEAVYLSDKMNSSFADEHSVQSI